jgi:hypothetical protein
MVMMGHDRVLVRRVALQANTIAGNTKPCAVWLMAIAAGNACREHLALLEWGIVVRLFDVADLSVGMIDAARERRDRMGV